MIAAYPFGVLPEGERVTRYRLSCGEDAWVDILDYGATIQSITVPDRDGRPVDVVLGYDSPEDYAAGTLYFGATVGRHAGRIGGGRFTLGGREYRLAVNDGPNHLHGGLYGFHRRRFQAEIQGETLCLRLLSPDGDQGYPGTLRLAVYFTFSQKALTIRYRAESDRDTVINLTNHSYFDLSGGRDPMGQLLTLRAGAYLENDENTLPTGAILPTAGTPFDFSTEKPLGRDIGQNHPQLLRCGGYDHCFVLDTAESGAFARLRSPVTGIAMTAATDLPGVQLYSGNYVDAPRGKGERRYGPRDGVCLETQTFPNGMAIDGFPKPILRAGEVYDHTTVYAFSAEG